ncbi:MAG: apolipoprotein N-acyltransferase [Hyphomicrobium sp.]
MLTAVDRSRFDIAWWREAIAESTGWRRLLTAFFAGAASVLAFAPFFAAPILFVTLPVFVWLIDGASNWREAARDGWSFGFGYFFFSLVWVGEAFLVEADKFALFLPFAITLLPAGLAIFWAGAAALCRAGWFTGAARIFVFANALGAVEWLRGHLFTGLPWNVIGYALTATETTMQGAALIGAYGLTPLAVAIFAAPFILLADARADGRRIPLAAIAAITFSPLALLYVYGAWRLSEPTRFDNAVRLRIVQPSVPQREKWQAEHQRRIFDDHLALSATNAAGVPDKALGVTHVFWPEAAMPFLPLERPEALTAIAEALPEDVTLTTGAIRREAAAPNGALSDPGAKSFNSVIVFDHAARPVAVYDKIHLVPFGEYVPFDPLLSAVGFKKLTHGLGAFSAGEKPRPVLSIPGLPRTVALVCYEALFPGEIVQGAERPRLLVNVTNDGWFGNSTGPRQHFHQARVRAVEEGAPLIRVANNGISAVVDRRGRVLQSLGMNVRGVIDSPLPKEAKPTPYSRFGDKGLALILLAFTVAALAIGRGKYR